MFGDINTESEYKIMKELSPYWQKFPSNMKNVYITCSEEFEYAY